MTFTRITTISPAFDKRDPNPNKNYGIHGCDLRMVLKGDRGAVQFVVYTNWQLPHVQEEQRRKYSPDKYFLFEPMPADVGYHSPTPHYENQPQIGDACEYLDGKPCYYDGSGLRAEDWFKVMLEKGSDEIWRLLEEYYAHVFETEATP